MEGLLINHKIFGAENKTTFFNRISTIYPTLDYRYKMVDHAYSITKEAFRERYRENGERYFEHLRYTALILIDILRVRDHELICAALLHDIVEDVKEWTVERVKNEFGERIALLVEWLTKPKAEDFGGSKEKRNTSYYKRIFIAPRDFWVIKLSDRLHNLLTMWSCEKEKIRRKIEETKTYFLPAAEREIILVHEIEAAIFALEHEKC